MPITTIANGESGLENPSETPEPRQENAEFVEGATCSSNDDAHSSENYSVVMGEFDGEPESMLILHLGDVVSAIDQLCTLGSDIRCASSEMLRNGMILVRPETHMSDRVL